MDSSKSVLPQQGYVIPREPRGCYRKFERKIEENRVRRRKTRLVVIAHDLIKITVRYSKRAQLFMVFDEAIRISVRGRDCQHDELFLASGRSALIQEHGGDDSCFGFN